MADHVGAAVSAGAEHELTPTGINGDLIPSRIPSTSPFHQPRALTLAERERFRETAAASRRAKQAALSGIGPEPVHDLNVPTFEPLDLMPQLPAAGLGSLSLFSGGGGLDLGFDRAGTTHVASFEIITEAAETLRAARPSWKVFGGGEGDVTNVRWHRWRDDVDLVHGGPPCQPFSVAGRQMGKDDARDMWPAFVDCVLQTRPRAFVAENVPAIASPKFTAYVRENIKGPLENKYSIFQMTLRAADFGIPQTRRRVFFVGFARKQDARRYVPPEPTHAWFENSSHRDPTRKRTLGLREALGLPEIGYDALSPTIRSTLTGPRHTTSILNSVAAQRVFDRLKVWPNGVAADRESARLFVAKNGHFRLAVPDVALIQGFPQDWPFVGATYMKLGQIGNAVPPPLGYAVASSVLAALA